MTRERLAWVLIVLLTALGGWWLSANTEWVGKDVPVPPRGEARDNPIYAAEQLLRRLGMRTERREQLDQLPPEGARLVLMSSNWTLVPERAERLRQWVRRGGHLVLLDDAGWEATPLADWVPIRSVRVKELSRSERLAEELARVRREAGAPANAPGPSPRNLGIDEEDEDEADELDDAPGRNPRIDVALRLRSTPPLLGQVAHVSSCTVYRHGSRLTLLPGQSARWTIADSQGALAVRWGLGQGSVTALDVGSFPFNSRMAVSCDRPLLMAEAVQARPDATVWFFMGERREPLLSWLWQQGWLAVVLAALALAAALWRGAVRFGPRLAAPPRLRRSITEQVLGLGAYLRRHGRDALLAAQQRALHEAALRALRGYARMDRAERITAVAEATGLPRDDLHTPMTSRDCPRAELPACLHLLETARRRLNRTSDERTSP